MADVQKEVLIKVNLDTGQVQNELQNLKQEVNNIGQGAKVDSFASIKAEINKARNEAIALKIAIDEGAAAGQNVDALKSRYEGLIQRTAELRDTVGDVNQRIGDANPDNRLQGLISVAQGAVGAIQGVAGAFTLLGVDAEGANEAIAKLQALLLIGNAVSSIDQIKNAFTSLRAIILGTTVVQRANTAATVAATSIQTAFGASVVGTGAAFTALRTAIIATGIGALVVGIGLAVAALVNWASAASDAEEESRSLASGIDALAASYEYLQRARNQQNSEEILRLKIAGASEVEIRKAQVNQSKKDYEEAYQFRRQVAIEYNKAIQNADKETFDKLTQQLNNADKALEDATNKYRTSQGELQLQIADDARAAEEEARQQAEQRAREAQQRVKEFNIFLEGVREENLKATLSAQDRELFEIDKKYKKQLDFARRNGRGEADILEAIEREKKAIRDKFNSNTTIQALEVQLQRLKFELDGLVEQRKGLLETTPLNVEAIKNNADELIKKYDEIKNAQIGIENETSKIRENSVLGDPKALESVKNQNKINLDIIVADYQKAVNGINESNNQVVQTSILQTFDSLINGVDSRINDLLQKQVDRSKNIKFDGIKPPTGVPTQDELKVELDNYYNLLAERERLEFEKRKQAAQGNADQLLAITNEYNARAIELDRQRAEEQRAIDNASFQSKVEIFSQIGNALGSLSEIFGKSTAAGKATALAEIAINTGVGFANGLRIAQQTAQAAGPGAAFAFPIFYATQVAAVLAAAARAKSILSQVKGSNSGGGSTTAPPAPTAPTLNTTLFNLPQEAQNVRVINDGQNVVRAYVVQDELRTAQQKQDFLNKLSNF